MADNDTSSDPSALAAESKSSAVPPGADGAGSDTIELVFSGTELGEFLNAPTMHGDLSDWLTPVPMADAQPQDQHLAVQAASQAATLANDEQKDAAPMSREELLASLGDDMFESGGGEDLLEAATRLAKPAAGGDDITFLLTEIDIGDLIGDYDQALDPGLGSEAEFLDPFSAPAPPLHLEGPGPIMIEIEDEWGVTAAHILS